MKTIRTGVMASPILAALLAPPAAHAATLKTLYTFTGSGNSGVSPAYTLTFNQGALYGVTLFGGSRGIGTIFEFDLGTGTETLLHSFAGGADGGNPSSELALVGGEFYGLTESGGTTGCGGLGCGTLYKYDPASGNESVSYAFMGGSDGYAPSGGLVSVNNVFYGVTAAGGAGGKNCPKGVAGGCGTVFRFDPASGTETVLYTFLGGNDGLQPEGPLIASGGYLFGTTYHGGNAACKYGGCGTVFEVNIATGAETVLYGFAGGDNGAYPVTLTPMAGIAYGTTQLGGKSNNGVLFEVDLATGAVTIVSSLKKQDGSKPQGGLAFQTENTAHHGSLHRGIGYGPNLYGGQAGVGTLFNVNVDTGRETLLYSFTGGTDGDEPTGGLIYQNNIFYGTTSASQPGFGTIFSVTP